MLMVNNNFKAIKKVLIRINRIIDNLIKNIRISIRNLIAMEGKSFRAIRKVRGLVRKDRIIKKVDLLLV